MIVEKLLIIVPYQFYHNLTELKKIIIIYSCIINFIEKNNLLCENQCVFRKHSSTIFAINSIHDNCKNNIDLNLHTCCLFLNLSNAFDTVDHDILLDKLYRNFGTHGKSLDLFTSYLKTDINILLYVTSCLHISKYYAGYPWDLALGCYFLIEH